MTVRKEFRLPFELVLLVYASTMISIIDSRTTTPSSRFHLEAQYFFGPSAMSFTAIS